MLYPFFAAMAILVILSIAWYIYFSNYIRKKEREAERLRREREEWFNEFSSCLKVSKCASEIPITCEVLQ